MEGQRRLDTAHHGFVEGPGESLQGEVTRSVDDHQLRDERVVVGRDPIAGLDAGVYADPGSARHLPSGDPAWSRREVASGILGRQPDLDRVTPGLCRPLGGVEDRLAQWASRRDGELLPDDVDVGDELRHAVLDLEPRVHLEEPEPPILVEQELGGRRVLEAHRPGGPNGELVEVPPLVHGQPGRRRLLDQLLVPALEGAVAFAEGHDRAVAIADELDLDVTGGADLALQVDRSVPERRPCLRGRGGQRRRQLADAIDPAHAPPAPAGRGLDQQREADPLGVGDDRVELIRAIDGGRLECPGYHGHASIGCRSTRGELVAEGRDGRARRPDEHEPGALDGSRE